MKERGIKEGGRMARSSKRKGKAMKIKERRKIEIEIKKEDQGMKNN